jgi:hypothetical protein
VTDCVYYLVRYVPNPVTGLFTNIGVFLHCPQAEFLGCMFTDDFSDVLRLHPEADLELLQEFQSHFEQQINENKHRLEAYIRGLQDTYSNLIQLSDPQPTAADDCEAKLLEIFKALINPA